MAIQTDEEIRTQISESYLDLDKESKLTGLSVSILAESLKSGTYPTANGFRYYPDRPNSQQQHTKPEIKRVHLYYMAFEISGALKIREHIHTQGDVIERNQVPDIVANLARNAVNGNGAVGSGFNDVKWDRPCYICFLMDAGEWQYHYQDAAQNQNDSLHFSTRKGGRFSNKSFYNAHDFLINMPTPGVRRKVLCCENHHRTGTGDRQREAGDGDENYEFDLIYRVGLSPRTSDEKRMTIIIDPGGRNTGP